MAEAYQQVQEGMWDRLKARGSQAVGAVKGVKDRVTGTAKELAGDVLSKTAEIGGQALGVDASKGGLAKKGAEWAKGGKEEAAAGRRSGQEAKYTSYINNSAKTIVNDLKKLGMDLSVPEETLTQSLVDLISNSLENVQSERLPGPRQFAKDAPSEARYKDSEGKVGGQVARTGGQ